MQPKADTKAVAVKTVSSVLQTPDIRKRFDEVLGKKSSAFVSSVITAVNGNPSLKKCDPMSVVSSAMVAAAMDLPVNASLGFAYIVPYKDKAQFQIGYKGLIQLALRSGQYETINLVVVYEGELKKYDRFTGEMDLSGERKSDKVEGYLLYFKLLNGYKKNFFMTEKECRLHGKKYSQTFRKNFGLWVDDFDAMALKTVAKLGLSKYGILSVEMQKAFEADQAILDENGRPIYPDNNARNVDEADAAVAEKIKLAAAGHETTVEAIDEMTDEEKAAIIREEAGQ